MSQSPPALEPVLAWYRQHARPILEREAADRVPLFDAEVARMERMLHLVDEPLTVCVLGNAGVGKSTLLNALVGQADTVLPQGGCGPLTAQAIELGHGPTRYFTVEYLPPKNLNNLLLALEKTHEQELRRRDQAFAEAADVTVEAEDDEERWTAQATLPVANADPEAPRGDDKVQGYARQARLLIRGNQFAELDLGYLNDTLRGIFGRRPRWGSTLDPVDRPRVERIEAWVRAMREGNVRVERRATENARAFRAELREHAAGSMSPLIKAMKVGWDADILATGLRLVDLPGVGVANDEYRRVTSAWIRKARGVVLVVDRAGITDAGADLLRTTGFLNSLLHDDGDPSAVPITLLVAVVKLDEPARDAWRLERETSPDDYRSWAAHFQEICANMKEVVRSQLEAQLARIADEAPEESREAVRRTMRGILANLEVRPVAALEYQKLLRDDPDDRPHLREPAQSHVPALIGTLKGLATAQRARVEGSLADSVHDFSTRVVGALQVILAQWEQDQRAAEELEVLRAELTRFLAPLREQLRARQGAFREYFRNTVPLEIENRVAQAAASATKDIEGYLGKYEQYHWATLRAAIRRGGTFQGARHVDLPNELTLRFEEPVAIVWSQHILTGLRTRTAELAEDYVSLVGEVVVWARAQGDRVDPRLVEALHEEMASEARLLANVGREAVDELKARVRGELYEGVEQRVRRSCQGFCDQHLDVGSGVRRRMLAHLRGALATEVVETAQQVATAVLTRNFRAVEVQIDEALDKYRDPLEAASSSIVASHEEIQRRSDTERRPYVLAAVRAVLAAAPAGW